MSSPTDYRSQIPAPLLNGTVRASHIVFLVTVIFVVTAIAGSRLSRSIDPDLRFAWQSIVAQSASALLVVILSLAVPELRKSIPILYSRGRGSLEAADAVLFVATLFAWTYGGHRLMIVLPVLSRYPELFSMAGYHEHVPALSATYLFLGLVVSTIIAPLLEELVFRGFLQNLFHRQWGLWPGIILSSFFFGLAHLQFAIYAMVAGIFFSLIYLRFASLWPGTLLHGLFNLIAAPFSISRMFVEKNPSELTLISTWLPELILTVAFFPLLYLFWRRFRPET
jgi:membrane protease YdiL (CAAX protease family)